MSLTIGFRPNKHNHETSAGILQKIGPAHQCVNKLCFNLGRVLARQFNVLFVEKGSWLLWVI